MIYIETYGVSKRNITSNLS